MYSSWNEKNGEGNAWWSWNNRQKQHSLWRALRKIGVKGKKEVQWGGRETGKILQKNYRIIRDTAIKPIYNDEGADRQGAKMSIREEEKGQGKRWSHY